MVRAESRLRNIEKIVCFQGRAGERAVGNIPGALAVAQAMSVEWNRPVSIIGAPSNPRNDSCADALSQARRALDELYRSVTAQRRAGLLPVCVLPTDGAAPAVLSAAINGSRDVSLVWFDAHADFNTPETTQSGFLGGMALAASCGLWNYGLPAATRAENVVLVGARAIDEAENDSLRRSAIRRLAALGDVASQLANLPLHPKAYIHLDLDCLEPGIVPLQYAEPGGMTPEAVRACVSGIVSRCEVVGLSISEFYRQPHSDADRGALHTVLEILAALRPN
jgi:arginase